MRYVVTQDFGPHKKGDVIEGATGMDRAHVVRVGDAPVTASVSEVAPAKQKRNR